VPRILVLGIGAMASLVGAHLARSAAAAVTVAGRWRAGLDSIRRHGVRVVERDSQAWSVHLHASERSPRLSGFDVVIVLGKTVQNGQLAPIAAGAVTRGGLVITLQDGLGNRDALERVVRDAHVVIGVTTIGATLLAPGVVAASPGAIVLGAGEATREPVDAFARVLARTELPVTVSDTIEDHLWRKLAVTCAIQPLSALQRVANGLLLEDSGSLATMTGAAREVAEVARAQDIALAPDEAAEMAVAAARATAAARSPMLLDLMRGSPTEIDSLNGAVCREARRLAVAVPINQRLADDIARAERRSPLLRLTS
jgi:2-dehydropantoate 2-reductase